MSGVGYAKEISTASIWRPVDEREKKIEENVGREIKYGNIKMLQKNLNTSSWALFYSSPEGYKGHV